MTTCYRHPDQVAGVVCQRCDRPICPRCMNQASVGFHCPECAKSGRQKVYQGVNSLQSRTMLTMILIGVNVAVFVLGVVSEGLDRVGAVLSGTLTQMHLDYSVIAATHPVLGEGVGLGGGVGHGEAYRMITSGFLHYGVIHILMNMYALWILGGAVERMGGRLRFGLIYVVSILGGAVGALILNPGSYTAGASGGIFGLMGAIFLAQRAQGVAFRDSPLFMILMLNLFITFGIPNISVGGHLGGLVAGAASGWLLFDLGLNKKIDKRLPIVLVVGLGVACVVGGIAIANAWTP